jgi:hypothetical protein
MLHVFQRYVASVSEICCKRLFKMFQLFQCFIWMLHMLQWLYIYVASIY